MKIGMHLLICDSSIELLWSNIGYHHSLVDCIVVMANNPSNLLEKYIKILSKEFPNLYYVGPVAGEMTMDLQASVCTRMSLQLRDMGCDWVVPCDDDEFYTGGLRESIARADFAGFHVIDQDGFCFYSTEIDSWDLNPVRRMVWRDPDATKYEYRKAIHTTKNLVGLSPGNHWAFYEGFQPKRSRDSQIRIYHFTFREKKVFVNIGVPKTITENQILEKNLIRDTFMIEELNKRDLP